MSRTAPIVLVVLLGSLALAQAASAQIPRDTLRYPYGCVEDETLHPEWEGDPTPLRCTTSNFRRAQFDRRADFSSAQFDRRVDFFEAQFDSLAYFRRAQFDSLADFRDVQFNSWAYFTSVQFNSQVDFRVAQFDSRAYFRVAQFDSLANFIGAQFNSRADFSFAQFDSLAHFRDAQFWSPVDFRAVRFDSASTASFARTTFRDTLFLGHPLSKFPDDERITELDDVQRFDFRRVQFLSAGRDVRVSPIFRQEGDLIDSVEVRYPGAAVVLSGPVELQMQQAKFGFLHLAERLSYFEKEDIITYLKEESYAGSDQDQERFELDYLLARSTMYQKKSGTYERYAWYSPTLRWNQFYNALMGFGYRPFRIFRWAVGLILCFSLIYLLVLPNRINRYLGVNARAIKIPLRVGPWGVGRFSFGPWSFSRYRYDHFLNTFISCVYFSAMVFFTFRLKKDILTFFSHKEKYTIVTQWTLGLLVYLAFLILSQSGSILQQLKTLFLG